MSRIFMDGFETGRPAQHGSTSFGDWQDSLWQYDQTGVLSNRSVGVQTSVKRTGAYALAIHQGTGGYRLMLFRNLEQDLVEHYGRVYFRGSIDTDTQQASIVVLRDTDWGIVGRIYVRRNGSNFDLRLYVGGTVHETVLSAFPLNQFTRIEWRLLVDDTSGVFEVRVNGQVPIQAEQQTLSLGGADGGTYKLGTDLGDPAEVFVVLDWNESAATIESALEGIFGAGNVTVEADSDFTITFAASVGASGLEFADIDLTNATTPGLTVARSFSELSFTGNTDPTGKGHVRFLCIGKLDTGTHGYYYFDDIVINDTEGAVNNSWPVIGSIIGITPKGAGNYTEWTPDSGDNYARVNDVPHNTTGNVFSDELDNIDTYEMQELEADKGVDPAANIKAVQHLLMARYEDVESYVAPVLRSGLSDYVGGNTSVITSYSRYRQEIFEVNPFTSQLWDFAEVETLELGIKQKEHINWAGD